MALFRMREFEMGEFFVSRGRLVEHAQERTDPRPDTRLGGGVGDELTARVGFVDHPSNPFPLLDWHGRAFRTSRQGGLDGCGKQTGLSVRGAIDRLHRDTGASGDRRDGRSEIPAFEEELAGGRDDPRVVLSRPCTPARCVVTAPGSCVIRH